MNHFDQMIFNTKLNIPVLLKWIWNEREIQYYKYAYVLYMYVCMWVLLCGEYVYVNNNKKYQWWKVKQRLKQQCFGVVASVSVSAAHTTGNLSFSLIWFMRIDTINFIISIWYRYRDFDYMIWAKYSGCVFSRVFVVRCSNIVFSEINKMV